MSWGHGSWVMARQAAAVGSLCDVEGHPAHDILTTFSRQTHDIAQHNVRILQQSHDKLTTNSRLLTTPHDKLTYIFKLRSRLLTSFSRQTHDILTTSHNNSPHACSQN
eukprot:scaffold43244_cov55-Cyclotella_meneghiniana.AAC.1